MDKEIFNHFMYDQGWVYIPSIPSVLMEAVGGDTSKEWIQRPDNQNIYRKDNVGMTVFDEDIEKIDVKHIKQWLTDKYVSIRYTGHFVPIKIIKIVESNIEIAIFEVETGIEYYKAKNLKKCENILEEINPWEFYDNELCIRVRVGNVEYPYIKRELHLLRNNTILTKIK